MVLINIFMYWNDKKTENNIKMKVGCKLKPMLLTDSTEVPVGDEWLYETKYDGFRCLLTWEKGERTPILKSRNDNILNQMFPEIVCFCEDIYNEIQQYLPLMLDGELVYLINDFQSEFSICSDFSLSSASNCFTF